MRRLLVVHGLKRAGNHAVINWLRGHAPFEFFNNVIWINSILKGEPYPPPYENVDALLKTRIASRWERFIVSWTRPVMVSLEDHPLSVSAFKHPERIRTVNVLVLRDPRNLFASRIRMAGRLDVPCFRTDRTSMQRFIDLWKSQARECLGMTEVLRNKTCIYYNAWYASEAYRRRISDRLRFTFTDEGFNHVSDEGGGSSFDGMAFHGKGSQMNVLNRYVELTADEALILDRVLEDEELMKLADLIEDAYAPYVRAGEIRATLE
jgi:hypothetical protein